MDLMEFNKMAAAVLSALLFAFGSSALFDIIQGKRFSPKPGYTLPVAATAATPGEATASAAEFNFSAIAGLMQKASAENGQGVFRRCATCHTPDKGGRSGVGPNLWGIVGRDIAAAPGFNYSDALKRAEGEWTYEKLAAYVHDPKGYIPGNKMAFAGIKDNTELADLLFYLRTLNDNPPPLPQ
jgi:cytochrome c